METEINDNGLDKLSAVPGIEANVVRSMWEATKANRSKLDSCTSHEFEPVKLPEGVFQAMLSQRYRCKHCGGEIDNAAYHWFEVGRASVKRDYSAPPELSIKWYATPEEVHREMWTSVAVGNGMTYDQMISESTCCGEAADGAEIEISHDQEMQSIKDQGCWAFVDTTSNTVHAWASAEVDQSFVLHMLAHEVGYVTGLPENDDLQDDLRADQFGLVALEALRLMATRPLSVTGNASS